MHRCTVAHAQDSTEFQNSVSEQERHIHRVLETDEQIWLVRNNALESERDKIYYFPLGRY